MTLPENIYVMPYQATSKYHCQKQVQKQTDVCHEKREGGFHPPQGCTVYGNLCH